MRSEIKFIVEHAFKEDRADITSRILFSAKDRCKAFVLTKEKGIVCGTAIAAMAFRRADPGCKIKIYKKDGRAINPGDRVLEVRGKTAGILTAERKAINFLQHFSGVATFTSKFVHAVKGTRSRIYDTRKTIPGLRKLQKYAVRMGGAQNHRLNLAEMAMVKDNHLKAVEGAEFKVERLKARLPKGTLLEIEAKTMKEVKLALKSKADIIMLDNMPIPKLKKVIRFIRGFRPKPQIEVSGGVTLKTVGKIARLGVERISVGALTHSAPALDLSLEVEK